MDKETITIIVLCIIAVAALVSSVIIFYGIGFAKARRIYFPKLNMHNFLKIGDRVRLLALEEVTISRCNHDYIAVINFISSKTGYVSPKDTFIVDGNPFQDRKIGDALEVCLSPIGDGSSLYHKCLRATADPDKPNNSKTAQ